MTPNLVDRHARTGAPSDPFRHRLRGSRGMTLVEVMLALTTLLICSFVFSATFPTATRSRTKADHRALAVTLAQRELEAIRDVGYLGIQSFTGLSANGLVDSALATSPVTYSFSHIDLGSGQTLAGSLPAGRGVLWVSQQSTELSRVVIAVSWVEDDRTRNVTLTTLLSGT